MDIQPYNEQFQKVVNIIESAKERAYRKVNEELITMYRDIGEYISKQSQNSSYGDAFVQKLADFFSENYPELKGFNRRGLYRMKQFYELYQGEEKVSPLVTQLSWSNHLKIMSACKTMDERIFYMNMCIRENWKDRSTAVIMKDICCHKIHNRWHLKQLKRQQEIFFLTIMSLTFLMFPNQCLNMIYRNPSFVI